MTSTATISQRRRRGLLTPQRRADELIAQRTGMAELAESFGHVG
jgi:hypothetical protein